MYFRENVLSIVIFENSILPNSWNHFPLDLTRLVEQERLLIYVVFMEQGQLINYLYKRVRENGKNISFNLKSVLSVDYSSTQR